MIEVQSVNSRRVEYARNSTLTAAFQSGCADARHGLPYSAYVAPTAHSLSDHSSRPSPPPRQSSAFRRPRFQPSSFSFQLFARRSPPIKVNQGKSNQIKPIPHPETAPTSKTAFLPNEPKSAPLPAPTSPIKVNQTKSNQMQSWRLFQNPTHEHSRGYVLRSVRIFARREDFPDRGRSARFGRAKTQSRLETGAPWLRLCRAVFSAVEVRCPAQSIASHPSFLFREQCPWPGTPYHVHG